MTGVDAREGVAEAREPVAEGVHRADRGDEREVLGAVSREVVLGAAHDHLDAGCTRSRGLARRGRRVDARGDAAEPLDQQAREIGTTPAEIKGAIAGLQPERLEQLHELVLAQGIHERHRGVADEGEAIAGAHGVNCRYGRATSECAMQRAVVGGFERSPMKQAQDRLVLEAEVERRALMREIELKRLRVLVAVERERIREERVARRPEQKE